MKIGYLAIAVVTLSACQGTSGAPGAATSNSNSATVINGIAVPPEPDPTINNSTLLGIDSNGNGVRDDVERQIATLYGTNQDQYDGAMRAAKSNQQYLMANGDPVQSTTVIINDSNVGSCMNIRFNKDGIATDKAIDTMFYLTFNTISRLAAYKATLAASTAVYIPSVANPCQ